MRDFGAGGGFDPLRRAVDVVNALGEPADTERHRAALMRVLREHGERDVVLSDADVAGLREAARAIARVLSTDDPDTAAELINAMLERAGSRPRLSNHDGHGWHLHLVEEDAGWGDWLATTGALALGVLLSRRGYCSWGRCANCPRLFAHDGRGSSRRYCSPRCATRARVAAHRARG